MRLPAGIGSAPYFADRFEAGRALAVALAPLGLSAPLVLALPRGGVPVGSALAAAMGGELDLVVARKVGVPGHAELGMAAVTANGETVLEEDVLARLGLADEVIREAIELERAEARRRWAAYRGDASAPAVADRCVVVVDDGLATGVTARAALADVAGRCDGPPSRVVLAVPVAPRETVERLRRQVEVVCPFTRSHFRAVSMYYADFHQVSDAEVLRLLAAAGTR